VPGVRVCRVIWWLGLVVRGGSAAAAVAGVGPGEVRQPKRLLLLSGIREEGPVGDGS
jgi:hypothetical protein